MAIERIQLRRGTETQWSTTDPVLGAAEIGVELGTPNKFKIGDGSSLWSELDYFVASASGDLSGYISVDQKAAPNGVATLDSSGAIPTGQLANLINSAPSTLDTLSELAAALADDSSFAITVTTSLSNKSDIGHTHLAQDITDIDLASIDSLTTTLQTQSDQFYVDILTINDTLDDLSNTVNSLDYATSAHTHTASEITSTLEQIVSATYSLQSSDNGKTLVLDPQGGAIDITVDDVFSVGQRVDLYLRGTAASFISGTGQIESSGISMTTQYTVASIFCVASGIYAIVGSLE